MAASLKYSKVLADYVHKGVTFKVVYTDQWTKKKTGLMFVTKNNPTAFVSRLELEPMFELGPPRWFTVEYGGLLSVWDLGTHPPPPTEGGHR